MLHSPETTINSNTEVIYFPTYRPRCSHTLCSSCRVFNSTFTANVRNFELQQLLMYKWNCNNWYTNENGNLPIISIGFQRIWLFPNNQRINQVLQMHIDFYSALLMVTWAAFFWKTKQLIVIFSENIKRHVMKNSQQPVSAPSDYIQTKLHWENPGHGRNNIILSLCNV